MSFFTFQQLLTDGDYDVFGVIGDSIADGRGASIPTVEGNTLYNWTGSSFTPITTQSVTNDDPTKGSMWQSFATNYKSFLNRSVYLVNGASGGSEWYPNGDNNNWYTSGTLYAAFTAKMSAALTAARRAAPTAIFITLGINDVRGSITIGNITTGVNSMVTRLAADYPGVPVLVVQVGRTESTANSTALFAIRQLLRATCVAQSNWHMVGSGAVLTGVASAYNGDLLHFSQSANDLIGAQFARWFTNSAYSKWARSIISSHFDTITSGRKTAIDAWVTGMGSDYFLLNAFTPFKTSLEQNLAFDWSFLGFTSNVGGVFNVNDDVSTNGTTAQALVSSYVNSYYNQGSAGRNDFRYGVKIQSVVTAAGTAAILFGGDGGGFNIRVAQGSGVNPTNFAANVASSVNGTQADLAPATLYTVMRNGTNSYLFRNKTQDATSAVASSGANSSVIWIGAGLSGGSLVFPYAGSYEYYFAAPYSVFNYDNFYDVTEAMIAAW